MVLMVCCMMVERTLVSLVLVMMVVAGLHAFDNYYDAGGVTGYAVNTALGYDCSDTDNNNPSVAGITSSEIYANGYSEDTCVGNDLLEFYCGSNGPDVRAVNCINGCFAGACD